MSGSKKIERARKKDLQAILDLLEQNDLPTEDVSFSRMDLYVIRSGNRIIAAGAVERVADCALFRSLAVSEDHRGEGLGSKVTSYLIHEALNTNTREIFLLTETAESFFHKMGFEEIHRETVPSSIRSTKEFSELCPSSAKVMKLKK